MREFIPRNKEQMGHKLGSNTIISDYSTVSSQSGRIMAALFAICSRLKERKLSAPLLAACPLFIPLFLHWRSRYRDGLPDRRNLVSTFCLFHTGWDTLWRMITFMIVTWSPHAKLWVVRAGSSIHFDQGLLPVAIQSNTWASYRGVPFLKSESPVKRI